MKFGASVWPFQWQPPYDDAIQRIANLGFQATELIAWNREVLNTHYTPQRIRDYRSLLGDLGLELSEFVSTPRGMSSDEPAKRAQAVDHFKRLVEVAVELGASIVNTVSPTPFELRFPNITTKHLAQEWTLDFGLARDWEQNWRDYVDVIRQFCDICEDADIRYAVEPHPYRWVRNAASMRRLLDHVGSPALGMNFDPSHLFPMGEIPQMVVYEVGDRVFHCHFSDNDGTSNVHWRPGKGKIDWKGVLQGLKEVGFDGVISIELEDVPGVSRADRTATAEFDRENQLSKAYLASLCQELDITIE